MSLRGIETDKGMGCHTPVMLQEVLRVLSPRAGAVYIDGTFGGGGYTRALLEAAPCQVFAIDRDPAVLARAAVLKAEFPDRFFMTEGCFGSMDVLLQDRVGPNLTGIVLDIGVSSQQLDEGARGFSFRQDGPLDMRMSQSGMTAADVVNSFEEEALADIFFTYGEERKSRRIARKIVEVRRQKAFETTQELAALIHKVIPKTSKIDPATRVFQALRIYVNQELVELEKGLQAATHLLHEGGLLAVVTFHSLEDRIVKTFFKGPQETTSRYQPQPAAVVLPFQEGSRRPVVAGEEELSRNPRARSAKLRWGTRRGAQ